VASHTLNKFAVAAITVVALVASLGSLYLLVDFADSTADFTLFLAVQAVSSALLAAVTLVALPPDWRRPRAGVYALLFCFAFFIPIFGAAGMLLAVTLTLILPRRWRYRDFNAIQPVEYAPLENEGSTQLRVSSLRTALLDQSAPADVRMRSLVAMRSMPMRIVGPLIRRLLGDASDDLRLVAYGMLDSDEKRINALIAAELENLEKSPARDQRANSLRHLAELHWELVYTGLVQGDVRDHAIASALRHLSGALRLMPENSGLWMLRARLLHAQDDIGGAEEAFNIAVSCGLEESRALPYLAELAYAGRQFDIVRHYMRLIAGRQITSTMAPVVNYWTGGTTAGIAAPATQLPGAA
jgi:hypothetical protein